MLTAFLRTDATDYDDMTLFRRLIWHTKLKVIITILKSNLRSVLPRRIFLFCFQALSSKKSQRKSLAHSCELWSFFPSSKKKILTCLWVLWDYCSRFGSMQIQCKKRTMRSLSKHIDALQCFQATVLITFSLFYVTTNSKSYPHWKTARITRRKKRSFQDLKQRHWCWLTLVEC